jgi:hypothetical protein
MYLASAYPNSALSAGLMAVIALVMAGTLVIWLGLVFLADGSSRKKGAPQADRGHRAYDKTSSTPSVPGSGPLLGHLALRSSLCLAWNGVCRQVTLLGRQRRR